MWSVIQVLILMLRVMIHGWDKHVLLISLEKYVFLYHLRMIPFSLCWEDSVERLVLTNICLSLLLLHSLFNSKPHFYLTPVSFPTFHPFRLPPVTFHFRISLIHRINQYRIPFQLKIRIFPVPLNYGNKKSLFSQIPSPRLDPSLIRNHSLRVTLGLFYIILPLSLQGNTTHKIKHFPFCHLLHVQIPNLINLK